LEELRTAQFFHPRSRPCLVRVEGRTAPAGPGAAPRLDGLHVDARSTTRWNGWKKPVLRPNTCCPPLTMRVRRRNRGLRRATARGTLSTPLTFARRWRVVPRNKAHRGRTRDVRLLDTDRRPLRPGSSGATFPREHASARVRRRDTAPLALTILVRLRAQDPAAGTPACRGAEQTRTTADVACRGCKRARRGDRRAGAGR